MHDARRIDMSLAGEMKGLCEAVAAEHGINAADLRGSCRTARVCKARHEFMRGAYERGLGSLQQIGRFLGGRHHTTVLHGIRRARGLA